MDSWQCELPVVVIIVGDGMEDLDPYGDGERRGTGLHRLKMGWDVWEQER